MMSRHSIPIKSDSVNVANSPDRCKDYLDNRYTSNSEDSSAKVCNTDVCNTEVCNTEVATAFEELSTESSLNSVNEKITSHSSASMSDHDNNNVSNYFNSFRNEIPENGMRNVEIQMSPVKTRVAATFGEDTVVNLDQLMEVQFDGGDSDPEDPIDNTPSEDDLQDVDITDLQVDIIGNNIDNSALSGEENQSDVAQQGPPDEKESNTNPSDKISLTKERIIDEEVKANYSNHVAEKSEENMLGDKENKTADFNDALKLSTEDSKLDDEEDKHLKSNVTMDPSLGSSSRESKDHNKDEKLESSRDLEYDTEDVTKIENIEEIVNKYKNDDEIVEKTAKMEEQQNGAEERAEIIMGNLNEVVVIDVVQENPQSMEGVDKIARTENLLYDSGADTGNMHTVNVTENVEMNDGDPFLNSEFCKNGDVEDIMDEGKVEDQTGGNEVSERGVEIEYEKIDCDKLIESKRYEDMENDSSIGAKSEKGNYTEILEVTVEDIYKHTYLENTTECDEAHSVDEKVNGDEEEETKGCIEENNEKELSDLETEKCQEANEVLDGNKEINVTKDEHGVDIEDTNIDNIVIEDLLVEEIQNNAKADKESIDVIEEDNDGRRNLEILGNEEKEDSFKEKGLMTEESETYIEENNKADNGKEPTTEEGVKDINKSITVGGIAEDASAIRESHGKEKMTTGESTHISEEPFDDDAVKEHINQNRRGIETSESKEEKEIQIKNSEFINTDASIQEDEENAIKLSEVTNEPGDDVLIGAKDLHDYALENKENIETNEKAVHGNNFNELDKIEEIKENIEENSHMSIIEKCVKSDSGLEISETDVANINGLKALSLKSNNHGEDNSHLNGNTYSRHLSDSSKAISPRKGIKVEEDEIETAIRSVQFDEEMGKVREELDVVAQDSETDHTLCIVHDSSSERITELVCSEAKTDEMAAKDPGIQEDSKVYREDEVSPAAENPKKRKRKCKMTRSRSASQKGNVSATSRRSQVKGNGQTDKPASRAGSTSTSRASSAAEKKIPPIKAPVWNAPPPKIKQARSKIGSLDNVTHKPKGGEKKVESVKLEWNAKSKVGSLDYATHKPGGGEKKIITQKVDFKNVQSKVGSKDNLKHKPGGGNLKIATEKLDFKEKAASKVGSLENAKHKPGGGSVVIKSEKLLFKEKAASKILSKSGSERGSSQGGSETGSPVPPSSPVPPESMPPLREDDNPSSQEEKKPEPVGQESNVHNFNGASSENTNMKDPDIKEAGDTSQSNEKVARNDDEEHC